jgi:hypothetical protein
MQVDRHLRPALRLTGADYRSAGLTAGSTGERFEYAYGAVGNPVLLRSRDELPPWR